MPTKKKATTTKRETASKKTTAIKRKATKQKKTHKLATPRTVRKPTKKIPKKVAPIKPIKLGVQKKAMTKTQLISHLAESTRVAKKDVSAVFECLDTILQAHIKKGAVGQFTLFGLAKFRVVRKPAVKARKGINPFTGESTVFKAKPARNVVKIRPLQKVKNMVS